MKATILRGLSDGASIKLIILYLKKSFLFGMEFLRNLQMMIKNAEKKINISEGNDIIFFSVMDG